MVHVDIPKLVNISESNSKLFGIIGECRGDINLFTVKRVL